MESAPKTPPSITLSGGRLCVLHELSCLDFQDGIEVLGKPPEQWVERSPDPKFPDDPEKQLITVPDQYRTIPALCWLMCRKDGLTREEIVARKWKVKLNEIAYDMKATDVLAHGWAIVECFLGVGATAGG